MRRSVLFPCLLLVAAVAAGCEKTTEDRLVAHVEAMVALLEEHRDVPERAAEALGAYVAEHGTELAALRKELADARTTLTKEQLAARADDLLVKLGPAMERAHRLMADRPALASDPRLRSALADLPPSP